MSNRDCSGSRRRFLETVVVSLAALPLGTLAPSRRILAEELPKLDEQAAEARAVGYVHDASNADDEQFEEGQICGNCMLFSNEDEGWGRCSVFPGKRVSARGWCSIWSENIATDA